MDENKICQTCGADWNNDEGDDLEEYCEDCDVLENPPCEKHRKVIHQSWHASGMWWIWQEYCSPECPGLAQSVTAAPGAGERKERE